jgi:hypothetical protein
MDRLEQLAEAHYEIERRLWIADHPSPLKAETMVPHWNRLDNPAKDRSRQAVLEFLKAVKLIGTEGVQIPD